MINTYQNTKITVAVRKRPLNSKEQQLKEKDIIRVDSAGVVAVSEEKQKVDLTRYIEETSFKFDYAFDEQVDNRQIYQQTIHPLIHNAFNGAKISCFAYGQTGSGKTYTMKGDISKDVPGLYYLGAQQIFHYLAKSQFSHLHVTVSFFEIYCSKLYDLLNKRNELRILQDKKSNINVIGIEEKRIYNAQEFLNVIEHGSTLRVTSQNATNADSSRSHAILQIVLKNGKKNFGKISFIDLAGSERGADHSDQSRQTQIDGAQINKSLLALKECIRALDQGKNHIPFRGTKLTMVLKDSFVGFCNTVMICNVSPNSSSSENTMNTLKYADRVKELKRGEGAQGLSREEMRAREMMLPRANNRNCIKVEIGEGDDDEDIMNKMQMARRQTQQRQQQKMQIQEPYQPPKKITGRKTDFIPKHERNNLFENRNNEFMREKNLFQKQPLITNNVQYNLEQNNLNFLNTINANKWGTATQQNIEKTNIARNIQKNFELYCQDHEKLLQEEVAVMREEMVRMEHRRKGGNWHIDNISKYLNAIEQNIQSKMYLLQEMQSNLERIRRSVDTSATELNKQTLMEDTSSNSLFGNAYSQPLFRHSTHHPVNYHSYQAFHQQEQLLQDLPADQAYTNRF